MRQKAKFYRCMTYSKSHKAIEGHFIICNYDKVIGFLGASVCLSVRPSVTRNLHCACPENSSLCDKIGLSCR